MATIVVSPQSSDEPSDSELIELSIVVTEIDELDDQFDRIEVWRSKDGVAGPYEELTAQTWKFPRLPKDAGNQPLSPVMGALVYLVGKALELRLNEVDDITVIFSGVDPLTFSDAASQIPGQTVGRVNSYVDSTGVFVLKGAQPGTTSALRVLGGDAAAILGLPLTEPDSVANGRDPRIPLISGQTTYSFVDGYGSSEYFYKTRYRNSSTGAVSAFSQPFSADSATELLPTSLVVGVLDVIDAAGRPLENIEVRIRTLFDGVLVDDRAIVGRDLVGRTDKNGHVEFTLVRGQKASVALIGSDVVRDILTPTDPNITVFNLLSASVGAGDDVFKVQQPKLIYAERRTL